jgi:Type II intron maturase
VRETDFSLLTQYQAEYRGIVQYYLLAFNVHCLWRLQRVMRLSLAKTLANKYRSSVNQVLHKSQRTLVTPHGTPKVLEVTMHQGPDKKPLVARFGGIELRGQKHARLDDHPTAVFNVRSEVVQRLRAQVCEGCGTTAHCQVHHIRNLADLRRPGRREKPLWVQRMAARRRKPLVVCHTCHEAIHREWASQRRIRS